jgi:hypothetical protein
MLNYKQKVIISKVRDQMPQKPDPETFIRELEEDPLTRLTWWLFDQIRRMIGNIGALLNWMRGGFRDGRHPLGHRRLHVYPQCDAAGDSGRGGGPAAD